MFVLTHKTKLTKFLGGIDESSKIWASIFNCDFKLIINGLVQLRSHFLDWKNLKKKRLLLIKDTECMLVHLQFDWVFAGFALLLSSYGCWLIESRCKRNLQWCPSHISLSRGSQLLKGHPKITKKGLSNLLSSAP